MKIPNLCKKCWRREFFTQKTKCYLHYKGKDKCSRNYPIYEEDPTIEYEKNCKIS
jgi:hypothetical protein